MPPARDQFVMRALLDDAALIHDHKPVEHGDG